MSWFHKHRWSTMMTTYAEPRLLRTSSVSGEGAKEFLERAAFGVTTVMRECDVCHKQETIEMLGKEVPFPQ